MLPLRTFRLSILVTGIALALSLAPAAETQSVANVPSGQVISSTHQVIYAPIAGLEDFARWEVAVVNRDAKPVSATMTVYSSEGNPYSFTKIKLNGNETQHLDIKALIPPEATEHTIGGLSIEFFGMVMGIGAQVTISGFHGFGNVDAPVFGDMMYKSNIADAVWWQPEGSHSYLILGNSSTDSMHAELAYGNGQEQDVDIPPHATVVQSVPHGHEGMQGGHNNIDSVHVVGTGMAGTLRVTGYAVSARDGFLDTIRSYDPASSSESAVYANGLHFSEGSNHLIAKNLTSNTISVGGMVYLMATNAGGTSLAIPEKQLTPGAVAELDLPATQGLDSLDGAAIKIESSGSIASVIASFSNHDKQNKITRSVTFKDIGEYGVSTGGYPWRIDGNYQSRIFITNVGKVRSAFGGSIRPSNGPDYFIDTHYLEVGETAIFDIRQLRDEQTPDPRGRTLSRDVKLGQFDWTTIFGDGSQRFIGRNEVIDRTSGVSASFSCGGICNCPYSTLSAFITPTSPIVRVNGTSSVTATGHSTSVCGGVSSDYTIYPAPWNINTPGYFSLSSGQASSTMSGTNGGSSSFYTPFNGTDYAWNGQTGQCILNGTPPLNPGGQGTSCDFSISPGAITNAFCDGTQNTQNYVGNVTPSLSSCAFQPSQSSCSFSVVSGAIESAGNTNNLSSSLASCQGKYFAGPGTSGHQVGTVNFSMTLRLGQTTVSHNSNVEVDCR